MEELLNKLPTLDQLPDWLAIETGNWWIVQVFFVVFLTLSANIIVRQTFARLEVELTKTANLWDDALIAAIKKPAAYLIWLIGFSAAIELLQSTAQSALFNLINPARDVLLISILGWFLIRLIREVESKYLIEQVKIDATTVHAIGKLLRLSVLITTSLVIIQSLGYSISGVLAFGGIGGVAVGFAAKDLLANFFGGLMLYLDQPFRVGDWVRSPDRDIEGTVEEIGWRLTRIRTFSKRPIYIPNSLFANIVVENPSRMLHRRIYETIGVRYDDLSVLPKIVAEVEAMLTAHPDIATDQTLIVNFDRFGASALDFFIYTFTKTTDWLEYHAIKERVLLEVADIIVRNGAEIAFPTTTVHLHSDASMPPSLAAPTEA